MAGGRRPAAGGGRTMNGLSMAVETGFVGELIGFLFRTEEIPQAVTEGLVFAATSALGFAVFVLIDFLRFVIGRIGSSRGGVGLHLEHGKATALYLVCGGAAAGLVGLVAVRLNLVEREPASAIVVGLTWEVIFERLAAQALHLPRDRIHVGGRTDEDPVQELRKEE